MYWFRDQVLSLDSARNFSRGNPISVMASLAQLVESSNTCTLVSQSLEKRRLYGQVSFQQNERAAHLSFVLPEEDCNRPEMVKLIEELAVRAGEWGIYNLLGEIDESSPMFETLRKAGFVVYARQKVIQLHFDEADQEIERQWIVSARVNEISIKNLICSLMPPLVQSAEPFSKKRQGFIYFHKGELQAFVDCTFGPAGIYLQPFFHPAVKDCGELLKGLLSHLYPVLGRPVYLAVRFYQAWLESQLSEKSQVVSHQVLMVKYLAVSQRSLVYNPAFQGVEGVQAEPTTSISKFNNQKGC
ncbi:MAG: hypothetical protein JEZ06_18065 [Anaerolineaceae bacterium]|nr:hypothetical protein [Anaerolineaceae bacterium]